MSDIFPSGEQADLALVSSLNTDGYILDQVPEDVVGRLENHNNPRYRELGNFFRGNNSFGCDHNGNYEFSARLARVREASGVAATAFEPGIREKLNWGPGENVNLNELMQTVGEGEEVQIIDYRGRHYQMIREPNGFRVIGAYDEERQPITHNGNRVEGQLVHVSKFPTQSDRELARLGRSVEPNILLVEPGQKTVRTPTGEVYTERRNGHVRNAHALRLQLSFPSLSEAFGVLVSKLKVIPKDLGELEKLDTAKWRIDDSTQVVKQIVEEQRGASTWLHSQVEISVGNERFNGFRFEKDGEVGFAVEDYSSGSPVRMEYVFNPNGNNSEKKYIESPRGWVAEYNPELAVDGSKHIPIQQAARKLDEFRYKLVESTKQA